MKETMELLTDEDEFTPTVLGATSPEQAIEFAGRFLDWDDDYKWTKPEHWHEVELALHSHQMTEEDAENDGIDCYCDEGWWCANGDGPSRKGWGAASDG